MGEKKPSEQEVVDVISQVWDRNDDEEWRKDQSHYRGEGRWADDERWQKIGQLTASQLRMAAKMAGRESDLRNLRILEWGPGGGSNVFALKDIADQYFGVDISAKNLAECQRMITAEGYDQLFRPILLDGEPENIKKMVDGEVDAFLSTAVFQHFPNQDYGSEVLKAIRSVCATDAIGLIQIRFDNGNPRYAPKENIQEYASDPRTATSYKLDDFWVLLHERGFAPLAILKISQRNNYATFLIKAR
ncbi:MAG: class I SAM-dependent methyltransferase [Parasphingopyxis sp.]|uniref:class I SAM-dependent methyltransferase n=1 Tax=Parasphingopyxis sp. TaxID=1920299 RepID=UPI003FA0C150